MAITLFVEHRLNSGYRKGTIRILLGSNAWQPFFMNNFHDEQQLMIINNKGPALTIVFVPFYGKWFYSCTPTPTHTNRPANVLCEADTRLRFLEHQRLLICQPYYTAALWMKEEHSQFAAHHQTDEGKTILYDFLLPTNRCYCSPQIAIGLTS